MKKIIAAAAGLMMVGVMASSASAVESQFGGYWRTRMFTQFDFDAADRSGTVSQADTRTRLYYTAVFNENFKFVNKFEMDAVWGGEKAGYGDIGADGVKVEVKNSYADFTLGAVNLKVGVQGATIARGFLFSDDFAGIVAVADAGAVTLPFVWVKVDDDREGWVVSAPGTPYNGVDAERDYYAVMPIIKVSDIVTLNPYFLYDKVEAAGWNNFYAGMDVDAKMDAFSAWGTFIYQFGEIVDTDTSAFLVAGGGEVGPVHGQVFYASGQDAGDTDRTVFVNPKGRSYYWSEIMGYGMFDNAASAGSPTDGISNVWAANVGFKVKPMDKLTVGADLWYAELAEENVFGDADLGFEVDGRVTYKVMDNLSLDLVAAYLLAGDATRTNDEDPIEVGAQLSLSF